MPSESLIKILMIEEDLEYTKSLTRSLSGVKAFVFSISCAPSLSKAFSQIETEDFDVVLLDLFLPQCQGLLTLKKLRACNSDLPIIILTGKEDVELAINAVRYGAQDYLIKSQITSHFLSLAIRYAVERKKTEKFHREQLHFLQSVMDNIPNPLFVKDTDLLFNVCNLAFEEMFGFTKTNIIGRTVFEIFEQKTSEIIRGKELKLLSGEQTQIYELSVPDKNGKVRNLFFYETAHRRADGTLGGLIGVATDVSELKEVESSLINAKKELETKVLKRTEDLLSTNTQLKKQIEKRKNLEKLLHRERKIFMNGPVVVFRYSLLNNVTSVEYVSPTIKQFGYEPDEFISDKLKYFDIIHPSHKKKVVSEIIQYSKSDVEHFEQNYSIKKKNGELRRVHSYVVIGRDKDRKIMHFDRYLFDITDWK